MRLALALALILSACASPPLAGTDLGKRAAPDFTLEDGPTGERVSLSALRGRAVLLTFLYTQCPDVCPLTAEKLREARNALGDQARDLALVAVSVDPDGDTPAATREFVRGHRLEGALRFLIGDRPTLAPTWAAYGIAAEPQRASDARPLVAHNDAIYLIDKQGRLRSLLHSDLEVAVLVSSLRILVGESRLF